MPHLFFICTLYDRIQMYKMQIHAFTITLSYESALSFQSQITILFVIFVPKKLCAINSICVASIFFRTSLGGANDAGAAFAESMEEFGAGCDDPISVAIGGWFTLFWGFMMVVKYSNLCNVFN